MVTAKNIGINLDYYIEMNYKHVIPNQALST